MNIYWCGVNKSQVINLKKVRCIDKSNRLDGKMYYIVFEFEKGYTRSFCYENEIVRDKAFDRLIEQLIDNILLI